MKHRSLVDYKEIYDCDKEGFNLGLDASIFIRREAVQRVFERPRVGTQGSSIGVAAASTNISAGSDDKIDIVVDGGAVVTATLNLVGLTTGVAIAAELELAINNALIAAVQDGRVWVLFDGGDDHYEIYSQSTGLTSSAAISDASVDNVADDLKIGVPNAGVEAAGTDDQDFLLYTTGGPTLEQPVESNPHRTGRFHTGIIRKKKLANFDFDTMVNMSGNAGDSIDLALRVLMEQTFGTEEVVASTAIIYKQTTPCFTFSLVRVSTIFGEYYTGGYVRDYTLSIPGDAPATQKFVGRAAKASIAGLARVDGALVGATDIILDAGTSKRYTAESRVMVVAADGRTVTAGIDGTLIVDSVDDGLNKVILNTAVDVEDDGYIVPWHPGAVQQTGRDAIYTDLVGRFKFNSADADIDTTQIEVGYTNDHIDFDNRFGRDGNVGFAAGNRGTMNLAVTFDLSNENMGDVVRARDFAGFDPVIEIGDSAGSDRYLKLAMKKWIPSVPAINVPENGTTPITFEGTVLQSAPGARDPFQFEYR